MKNVILDNEQITQKIKRIAYQIYEINCDESEIVIAGIIGNGFQLAIKIKENLELISPLKITLCEVKIDKKNPLNIISTSIPLDSLKDLSVVLVDDVLSTGKTLIYGVAHFLQLPLKQLKTAVLINRNHKKYPVKADFKGLSLSTTSQEHISIEIKNGLFTAYLK